MGLFDQLKSAFSLPESTLNTQPGQSAKNSESAESVTSNSSAALSAKSLAKSQSSAAKPSSSAPVSMAPATVTTKEHFTSSQASEAVEKSQAPTESESQQATSQSPAASASEQVVESSASDSQIDKESQASEQSTAEVTEPTEAERYEKGLSKSRKTFGERINAFLANFRTVDEAFFDELEDTLISADVGFETATRISDELRDEVKLKNAKSKQAMSEVIVEKLVDMYGEEGAGEDNSIHMAASGPTVILFVGVNGAGKTTTIGKMANMYRQQGKKVLLAACDTFRAGAIQQLQEWGRRDQVEVVAGAEKSDPASVCFDAVKKAKAEDYDVLFVDTAGRLQNKVNLMNELAKIKRVITREIPDAPQEVLLVLDATTGQNALNQAKLFSETTNVTGIVLTKLDGTAKGGIVLAIRNELHLPVKYVGLGEKVTDLRPFKADDFVYGLFKDVIVA